MDKNAALYIVAYDLPNDRRRTKLHKMLKGFGQWTQFSLFECWLTDTQLAKLHGRLERMIKVDEDSVRIYPLCARCVTQVETIGSAAPRQESLYLV